MSIRSRVTLAALFLPVGVSGGAVTVAYAASAGQAAWSLSFAMAVFHLAAGAAALFSAVTAFSRPRIVYALAHLLLGYLGAIVVLSL